MSWVSSSCTTSCSSTQFWKGQWNNTDKGRSCAASMDVGTLRTNTQNGISMSLDYSVREEILYGCLSWLVDIKIASLIWMFWQVETQGDRRLMHILVGLDRIQVLGVLTSKKHHKKRCFPQTQNNHLYSDEENHLHSTSLSSLCPSWAGDPQKHWSPTEPLRMEGFLIVCVELLQVYVHLELLHHRLTLTYI